MSEAAKKIKVSIDGSDIIVKFFSYDLRFDKIKDATRFHDMIKDPYFLFLVVKNSFIIPRKNYKIRLVKEGESLELQIFSVIEKIIELKISAITLIEKMSSARMELHEIDYLIKEVKSVVNKLLDNK
jgi:hypothetical protein